MAADRKVTLYHSPQSRSVGALVLLEELGADYVLHTLDFAKGEQRHADYVHVNPMGKVPAIVHDGALVTEQGAVYAYLADLYPEAGITPAIGDALRGPYLRWLFFYGSSFEPALIDRSMKRDPAPAAKRNSVTTGFSDTMRVAGPTCTESPKSSSTNAPRDCACRSPHAMSASEPTNERAIRVNRLAVRTSTNGLREMELFWGSQQRQGG